jgi:hypothetical protein
MEWWSIEVFNGSVSAASWRDARSSSLIESAIANGAVALPEPEVESNLDPSYDPGPRLADAGRAPDRLTAAWGRQWAG